MTVRGTKALNEKLIDVIHREENGKSPVNPEDVVFALDIGTRSVVGIVGIEESGVFNIIDFEIVEHTSRAMMDGQIHEIGKVAEVVEIVKEKLESRLGFELTKVAIAAAGRALRTKSVVVEKKVEHNIVIAQEMINSLELEGIQMAHAMVNEENMEDTLYYCIGHTVINYYLNGYVISNLVGHKGKTIGANVLGTFLPHTVVDSLYSVMDKVGLRVISLTLEPIAAINVSIPQNIRLLNLALVDVGAGTSDIAITRDGSVMAYAMCSVAGDEITEKIAQHYLLDFNTAERVKVELQTKENIEFIDIMGVKHSKKTSDIIHVIEPAVRQLAQEVSEKILSCNGKAPNAVFCIGGGSQTPGFTKLLAENLELPQERVGIRGTEIIKDIRFIDKRLDGPEAITPVGIAITALLNRGHDFIQVKVNKKKVRLFNSGLVTIGDAVAVSGFSPSQLIPRAGKSLVFELNGRKHTVRGGYGRAAEIYINGNPSSLDTPINEGDNIKIVTSEEGHPAKGYIEDFVTDMESKKITFNGRSLDITTKVILNGGFGDLKHELNEDDKLYIEEVKTVKDLARFTEIDLSMFDIYVNGSKAKNEYVVKNNDIVTTVFKNDGQFHLEEQVEAPDLLDDHIFIEPKVEKQDFDQVLGGNEGNKEDEKVEVHHQKSITVTINDEEIKLKGKDGYIFVDIFNHYNIDLSDPKGRVILKLNGNPASFTDIIRDGDAIEIYWELK